MQPHAATDEVRLGGALRRLTQSIDVDAVRAWRSRLCTAIPAVNAHYPAAADASLSWAPLDAGVDACFEHWLAREHLQRDMVHDTMHGTVATLLQRGDTQRLARLMPLMLRYAEGAARASVSATGPLPTGITRRDWFPLPTKARRDVLPVARHQSRTTAVVTVASAMTAGRL